MWLLHLLPWCFIISLVGATACNLKMPETSSSCEEIIRWKHRDKKEATSTCLEYFPTTFLDGETHDPNKKNEKNEIKCTVYRQFECNHVPGTIPMFDKCYKFTDKEMTIEEYIAEGHKPPSIPLEPPKICGPGGALPVFFTMSQGKHIAMEAHRQGIEKIWVNLNSTGQTFDEPTDEKSKRVKKGFLLYKNLWKVHDKVYWNGDNLVSTPKEKDGPNKGKPKVPPKVKYLFFRSRTDYVYNLYQGSFERVMENSGTKARVVCEYPAKIVPDQKRYCEKMGKNGLGLNAKYDDSSVRKRCVYTTLSKYSLKGTIKAVDALSKSACAEKPSPDHSAGLDDGTASEGVYDTLTAHGTYRVAAIKMNTDLTGSNKQYAGNVRTKCDNSKPTFNQRQPYEIFDHFQKKDFSSMMASDWHKDYPKDECSDFPNGAMDSNTLAIRNKLIIDVPVPVRLPLLCSIETNVDCGLHPNVCKRSGRICTNTKTWKLETNLYAECVCARGHKEVKDANGEVGWCQWTGDNGSCGWIHRWSILDHPEDITNPLDMAHNWTEMKIGIGWDLWATPKYTTFSDYVDRIVVRVACTMTAWSHPPTSSENYKLVENAGYGEHVVPNDKAGTLNGWNWEQSASGIDCTC